MNYPEVVSHWLHTSRQFLLLGPAEEELLLLIRSTVYCYKQVSETWISMSVTHLAGIYNIRLSS